MRVVIVQGKGQFWGEFGRPIVTNWGFVAWLCKSDALFPNYCWGGLVCSSYVNFWLVYLASCVACKSAFEARKLQYHTV